VNAAAGTRWLGPAALCAALAGCAADRPLNPSFPLTLAAARQAARALDAAPRRPPRPVVVIGGILDSPARVDRLAARLRALTADDAVIVAVSVRDAPSFDAALAALQEALRALPSPAPGAAPAVDVVGLSMGGLVARRAAGEGRLRIRRLFTLATPHRGARAAMLPAWQARVRDMRPGSPFLRALDADLPRQVAAGMVVIPYVRLGDAVVGSANAAPPGQHPLWVANQPFQLSHSQIDGDERLLVDIARRLRGEPPYSSLPAAPLPAPAATRFGRHSR
jgi:pimeloyl-ACP methyl ester carboxylesterase